jgi:hypothetical protein
MQGRRYTMRKLLVLLSVVLLICGSAVVASAALVDQGNGTILDTNTGQYWYADLEYFSNETYSDQLDLIDGISLYDFHMASLSEMENLFGEYELSEITGVFGQSAPDTSVGDTTIRRWWGRYESVYECPPEDTHCSPATNYHFQAWISKNLNTSAYMGGETYLEQPDPGNYLEDSLVEDWLGAWAVEGTPVPVSATLWLLGSGLIGIVGIRRKFKI